MHLSHLQQQAQADWQQGNYEPASAGYEAAIALRATKSFALASHDLTDYWHLGLMHLLQNEIEAAQATWFAAIAETAPADLEVAVAELTHILQAEAQRQFDLKAWHLAERLYNQLLEFDPTPATGLALGRAYAYQGNLDEAITAWQTALDLDPDLVVAYCEQGQVWQKLEQYPAAIAAYTAALDRQPTGLIHHCLGFCLAQTQQWAAAAWHLKQAEQLNSNFAPAADLAQVLLHQGDWAGAIASLQRAVGSDWATSYWAWVAAGQSQPELVANAAWLQALANPTATVAIELALATLLVRSGQIQLAIALYEHIYQQEPDQPAAMIGLTAIQTLIEQHRQPSAADEAALPGVTTAAWRATPAGDYVALDAGSVITLQPPHTIAPEIHFSFRFPRAIPLPSTFVVTIPHGTFWINAQQSSTAILVGDRRLIDLSPEFPLLSPGHPEQSARPHACTAKAPAPRIEGTIAVLAGLSNDMYFHWLFDVLPRLDLIDRSGIHRDVIDGFLVSHHLPFQQETLAQLGIPASKILTPEDYPHWQADRLVVPSFPGSPAWMPAWACQWLRQTFLVDQPATATRLYISRRTTASRRVINETAVLAILTELGFQCVTLEALSVREQAALLASAEVVIAPHGGGLTNLVFCPPGAIVIEIFPPHFVYPCYWLICNLINLQYYYLIGAAPGGTYVHQLLYPNARLEDIFVDLNELQQVLKLAGVR
jgi:tetratricopeptide (TPR) repeat protein